ncbi:MAG: DUF1573 domain-containing protein [Bacteroidota bacterium]
MKLVFKTMILTLLISSHWLACQADDSEQQVAENTVVSVSAAEMTALKDTAMALETTLEKSVATNQSVELLEIDLSKEASVEKEGAEQMATAQKVSEKKKVKKKKSQKKRPKLSFKQETYNYGQIMQGDKVEYQFRFKNTGNADLVIKDATASCGCTKPSYPFIPIAPGEEGYIGVIFDSKGKLGMQKPSITVVTNASPKTYKLYLEGVVDTKRVEEKTETTTTPEKSQ